VLTPPRRVRTVLVGVILALLLTLVARSTPRHVGDSAEYVAMALNLSQFSRPSLTSVDLGEARSRFPGAAGELLTRPILRASDGRQDLVHFWFYPLLAAPFVRVASAIGADPVVGFAALNVLLLLCLAMLLAKRVSSPVVVLVVVSPILWWIDKAHTEVFTFSLLAAALLLMRSSPWWSIVAFGAAATQDPSMAIAMAITFVFALYERGWRDRRVWTAAIAGALLAGLHPAYYYLRLGTWSGLAHVIDWHWPSLLEFMAVAFDPNLGVFVHAPWFTAALVVAIVAALRRPDRRALDLAGATMALIGVLFLLSFMQTPNINSGGTPGPSRYGLWLIPFAVPIVGWISPPTRWLRLLAAASAVWCAWLFAPRLPERYLEPSTFASYLWQHWPGADDPLTEVFAERVAGHELAAPPVATPGCEKVLLASDGGDGSWPARCTSVPLPDFCRPNGTLCYANETRGAYRFVKAQATPAWRLALMRRNLDLPASPAGMLAVRQPAAGRTHVALWQDEGWSYPEQLSTPGPDDEFREWRWIDQRALAGVKAGAAITARFELVARAFNKPRRLRIAIDEREVATILVAPNIAAYTTPEFTLPAGRTLMTFESLDGSDPPNTSDPRRLSIQVYRIELVVVR
jgi:hypothetical protein